jgi:hypothetical protein
MLNACGVVNRSLGILAERWFRAEMKVDCSEDNSARVFIWLLPPTLPWLEFRIGTLDVVSRLWWYAEGLRVDPILESTCYPLDFGHPIANPPLKIDSPYIECSMTIKAGDRMSIFPERSPGPCPSLGSCCFHLRRRSKILMSEPLSQHLFGPTHTVQYGAVSQITIREQKRTIGFWSAVCIIFNRIIGTGYETFVFGKLVNNMITLIIASSLHKQQSSPSAGVWDCRCMLCDHSWCSTVWGASIDCYGA